MWSEVEIARLFQTVERQERVRLLTVKLNRGVRPLQILLTVDVEEGFITVDACAAVSRRFQDIIDLQDDAPADYRLVVSSPGIDWPMSELWQFRKNVGRLIRHSNRDRLMEGRIVTATDDVVALETPDGLKRLPIAELAGAKVVVEMPQHRQSKRKRNEKRNS
jgi:ribosome maturation factor RimP